MLSVADSQPVAIVSDWASVTANAAGVEGAVVSVGGGGVASAWSSA
jgi:hypothetical protein